MLFTRLAAVAFLGACASASPVGRTVAVSMSASDGAQWTLQNVSRACNSDSALCTWNYAISVGEGPSTPCSYNITGNPATEASQGPVTCGNFNVSSSWSGQFGPGKGFTTIAVVKGSQIAYPAYEDSELINGTTVHPDRSYPVQNLPGH